MRSERLLFAIGDISDELIENAQKEKVVNYRSRWITVAACFLILVTVLAFIFAGNFIP